MIRAYPLRVADIRRETKEAVSVVFAVPEQLEGLFRGAAGQHLVIRLDIDGEQARRPYSLSSSPAKGEPPTITVKAQTGGLVSSFINKQLGVGDEVAVEPPAGNFVVDTDADNYRTYYLFAGGSGITPIMSHLKTVLSAEPLSHVRMAYANKNHKSIIFKEELEEMAGEDRLRLVHYLSRSRRMAGSRHEVRSGPLDKDAIRRFLRDNPPVSQDCRYLVCGPSGLIDSVESALRRLGVPESDILVERFTPPPPQSSDNVFDGAAVSMSVGGMTTEAVVPAGVPMLDALIDKGAELSYACRSGICGTCTADLVSGEVHMAITFALTDAQITEGKILLCQAQPTTERVEVATN